MGALTIRDPDTIGILNDIYQQSVDKLNLDDDEYLSRVFLEEYAAEAVCSKEIPSVETLALKCDDRFQSEVDLICQLFGYSGAEYDYIMSRYEVNIAAYFDVKITEMLYDNGFSFIDIRGMLNQPIPQGLNILIGGFLDA